MKVKKVLAAVVCLLVACLGFAGCEWGNKKYSLELTSNNITMGKVESKPAQNEYQKGTEITVKATAFSGYEFVNWLDFETKSIILTASGVPEGAAYTFNIEKNTKLQAVFQRIVSFTYDLQGGKVKGTENTTINPVKGVKLNDVITLPVLEKAGFDFLGWTIGDNFVETATYTIVSIPANRADIVATARFRESKTVNFVLGGGVVEATGNETLDSIADVKKDTVVTLPRLVKTGYTFGGWQLGGRTITDETYAITNSDLDAQGSTITFTAKWTAKTYPLALLVKRGEGEGDWVAVDSTNRRLTYDQAIGELIKFNDNGDEAYFWYRDEALTQKIDETVLWKDDSKETVTFYGDVKAAKKYVIKVGDNDDGTTFKIAANDEKEYNIVKDVLKLDELTKEGHDFKGFSINDAEPVTTLKYETSEAGTYIAKFDIKQYNVKFGNTATEGKVSFNVTGYSDAEINPDFNTEIKFTVNVDEHYSLVDVYYTKAGSEDKHVLTATEGVYTFNVPADDIVVSATTKILYTVNYYNGETKIENVNAETYVTKLLQGSNDLSGKLIYTLPDFDKNFGGWALTNGGKAVINRDGTLTEGFWQAVSELEGTTLNLYAVWTDADKFSFYSYNMTQTGYSIVPLINSTYSQKFNKNVGLYEYLTYLKQTYGERLDEIKASVTSVTTSNQAEIMAYNMLKMLNLTDNEVIARWSQTKYNNLIVMDKSNNNNIVEVSTYIKIYFKDSTGKIIASNENGAISLEKLKSISGDVQIEFALALTNA